MFRPDRSSLYSTRQFERRLGDLGFESFLTESPSASVRILERLGELFLNIASVSSVDSCPFANPVCNVLHREAGRPNALLARQTFNTDPFGAREEGIHSWG